MAELLVDTDIFIDHFRGARELAGGKDRLWYSIITRVELFAGRVDQLDEVRLVLSRFDEIRIDDTIAERAGGIRREHRMELGDSLIAATAIENKLTLVTRNRRDFDRVRGLKVRSPA